MIIDKYFSAFGGKDISTIESLMADNVVLHDPSLGIVRGKSKVLRVTADIFNLGEIHIKILNRISDNGKSAVEFALTITNKNGEIQRINGVDIFTYKDDKINLIKAFVNIIK